MNLLECGFSSNKICYNFHFSQPSKVMILGHCKLLNLAVTLGFEFYYSKKIYRFQQHNKGKFRIIPALLTFAAAIKDRC